MVDGHRCVIVLAVAASFAALATLVPMMVVRGAGGDRGEWPAYGGSNASLKYAALDQINKDNAKDLRIAWRQSAMPSEVRRGRATVTVPTNYQVTPLMVGGLLFAPAGDGSIVALNPGTGAVVWSFVPPELKAAQGGGSDAPREVLAGRSANRGVAYWSDGAD